MSFHIEIILIIILLGYSKESLQLKIEKQIHEVLIKPVNVCQLCACNYYPKLNIQCAVRLKPFEIDLRENEQTKEITLDFNGIHLKTYQFSLDLDFSSQYNLRIFHNTFSYLKKLRILYLNLNKRIDLIVVVNLVDSTFLEELTIQNSFLKQVNSNFCNNKHHLKKIDFSNNDFESLAFIFDHCYNLNLLDLSYNRLGSLKHMFSRKSNIIYLILDHNKLKKINNYDLKYLRNIIELSISNNNLVLIEERAFDSLKNLKKLDLSWNNLKRLPEISPMYSQIERFFVNENPNLIFFPDEKQFFSLYELNVHYPYHCCQFRKRSQIESTQIKGDDTGVQSLTNKRKNKDPTNILMAVPYENDNIHSNPLELLIIDNEKTDYHHNQYIWSNKNLTCYPVPDKFTPCEDLLEGTLLRLLVWILSILGTVSNIAVIIYNVETGIKFYYENLNIDVPKFLLTNLALADSLMSIYLLFIAIKDATSKNNFGQSALTWQRSVSCNLAGFLSIVSYVSSSLCLAFITFERYYVIKNSIYFNKRINFRLALTIITLIWLVAFFEASLPLFNLNNYSAYAICLPFDTRNRIFQAYALSLNTLLILSFFFICLFYMLIFTNKMATERRSSQTSCNDTNGLKQRYKEDQKLARKISLLVLLNIFCWGPVVYLCFYSLATMTVINRSYLKIIAVVIVPFNSLINPFLYCLSEKHFSLFIRHHLVQIKRRNLM